jgi:hypothetical protein
MITFTERAGRVGSIRVREVQGSYRDAVTTYTVFHIPVFYSEDGGGWFLRNITNTSEVHDVTSKTTASFDLTCTLVVIPLVPFASFPQLAAP